jgi:hypothetical protein
MMKTFSVLVAAKAAPGAGDRAAWLDCSQATSTIDARKTMAIATGLPRKWRRLFIGLLSFFFGITKPYYHRAQIHSFVKRVRAKTQGRP